MSYEEKVRSLLRRGYEFHFDENGEVGFLSNHLQNVYRATFDAACKEEDLV